MAMNQFVIVRGGGDIATGTIYKLVKCGCQVLILETEHPSAIRRNVAFSEAVYEGKMTVEDMTAYRVNSLEEARQIMDQGAPALMVDPEGNMIKVAAPDVVVDAILAKRNLGTNRSMAPITIALGPGFTAGKDVDAVIETMRGHRLGRVICEGSAIPNTGVPGVIAGVAEKRVIHAPAQGILENIARITDTVREGQTIAVIRTPQGKEVKVTASIDGLLRGLIRDGYPVTEGFKIADIDPRVQEYENCFTISDKARCIAGGVIEAIEQIRQRNRREAAGIYADYAATCPTRPFAVRRRTEQAAAIAGNAGRGGYEGALTASRLIYEARVMVNDFFDGEDPADVVFTSGVTESLNTAICGLLRPGDHVVTTCMEHNSVLRPLYRMQKQGVTLTIADSCKAPLEEAVMAAVRAETRMIVMTHGSNVTGEVYDIRRVGHFCRERGILFVTDCAQTAGVYPVSMKEDAIDVLCFAGHKGLHALQGTGGMCIRKGVQIEPLKTGGTGIRSFSHAQPEHYPEHLEAGTGNLTGIASVMGGIEWIRQTGIGKIREHELDMLALLERETADIPGLIRYAGSDSASVRTAVFSCNIGGIDSARISDVLETEYHIKTRAGAHCAPLVHEWYGTVDQGMVRISLGYETTGQEVLKIAQALRILAGETV